MDEQTLHIMAAFLGERRSLAYSLAHFGSRELGHFVTVHCLNTTLQLPAAVLATAMERRLDHIEQELTANAVAFEPRAELTARAVPGPLEPGAPAVGDMTPKPAVATEHPPIA